MATFWEWWDGVVGKAIATDDGKAFVAAGFKLAHMGGGCSAWERDVDDTGCRILVTDSEGSSHDLAPGEDDHWIVGAHDDNGGFSAGREARTVAEAIKVADEMRALVIARDWAALGGEDASLPLKVKSAA